MIFKNNRMGIRKLYKNILVFSLTLIPLSGFCQGQTNSSDIFTKLLIGFVFAVVLGALYAIINLNKTLLDLQLERAGITKKKTTKSLWTKWKENLTDIVPVEKESNILLDHNYDGIEELDNSLPPWWLYGFYFSIIFSFFYIGYYHYYDYGLDSTQAYENEVLQAEIAVNAYLEKQANTIDESNLVYNNRSYRLDTLPKESIVSESDVYENRVIHTFLYNISIFLIELKEKFPNIDNLILTGGTALNCTNNFKIYKSGIFKNVYIPPFPSDECISFGLAQCLYYKDYPGNWKIKPSLRI